VAAGLVQVRRAVAERLDNIPGYQGYAFTQTRCPRRRSG